MKKRSIQAKKDPDIRTFEWYTDKFFQGFVFVAGISGIIFALGIFGFLGFFVLVCTSLSVLGA